MDPDWFVKMCRRASRETESWQAEEALNSLADTIEKELKKQEKAARKRLLTTGSTAP